jgi:hypothetical protein
MGINNLGDIVGGYAEHGYLLTHQGQASSIDMPGAIWTQAQSINDHGVIVGMYSVSEGHLAGFMLAHGTYTPLTMPGAVETSVQAINNKGQITGYFLDSQARYHGFVATLKKASR